MASRTSETAGTATTDAAQPLHFHFGLHSRISLAHPIDGVGEAARGQAQPLHWTVSVVAVPEVPAPRPERSWRRPAAAVDSDQKQAPSVWGRGRHENECFAHSSPCPI